MKRYVWVLFSVLALTLILNVPATYTAEQPELTKKEKRYVKRQARKIAKKQAQKKIDAVLPIETPNLATEAVTTPKIESGAVGTTEIADGAVSLAKLSANLQGGRKFYQTPTGYQGNAVLTACATGYHMAAMFELLNGSNLRYDTTNGLTRGDSGQGPPHGYFGWVRTGYDAATVYGHGFSNCSAWTSNSNDHYGSTTTLELSWDNSLQTAELTPWRADISTCAVTNRVWCIQD